jgi:hypothetical protein
MEKLVPDQLERRKAEDAEEEEEICPGGFKPWEHVAAASDISFGDILCVRQGTPGIVVCKSSDDYHLTVKFDRREDESDLCVDVKRSHLMKPLPGNFRLGQKVMACVDLHLNDNVVVALGSTGTIVAPAFTAVDHLLVSFDERCDGVEGYIAVDCASIAPDRLLVGGFRLGQKVLSNSDLLINHQLVVPRDTPGTVLSEYSDTRLNVAFDVGESDQNQESYESHCVFNVQPVEIRALPSLDIRPGDIVFTNCDLGTDGNVAVLAGTRGTVRTCIDELRIIVAFEGNEEHSINPQLLTVSESSIEKDIKTRAREHLQEQARIILEEDAKQAFEAALMRAAENLRRNLN